MRQSHSREFGLHQHLHSPTRARTAPVWALATLTCLTLVLASCGGTQLPGGGGPGGGNDKSPGGGTPTTPGTLEVEVQGVAKAKVEIAGPDTPISEEVSGQKDYQLAAGTYQIDGAPTKGFMDPSVTTVSVEPGTKKKVVLQYQTLEKDPAAPASGPLEVLEVISVSDETGAELPSHKERSKDKDVNLYASQTEESICVRVKAFDKAKIPVAGAQISVTPTGALGDNVAVIRGCAKSGVKPQGLRPMAFTDAIYTNKSGEAVFTMMATYAAYKSKSDEVGPDNGPVKVVLGAADATDQSGTGGSASEEFKVFFYNISHLYYGALPTEVRTGKVFSEEINLFKAKGDKVDDGEPGANQHEIIAALNKKQPNRPIKLPWKAYFGFKFELIEGGDRVRFAPGTFDTNDGDKIVFDDDGAVKIEPKPKLGLKDLPIQAKVKVTLIARARYGDKVYEFPLKDFVICKKWIGSYLSIKKTVDHHVLTWAGPEHHLHDIPGYGPKPGDKTDHTLESKDDPAVAQDSVFTSTVTIKVKNEGKDPVYNLTIADALPAELGPLTKSVKPEPNGQTYDGVNHVLTWNWQNMKDPTLFKKLEPGQEVTVNFQVYLRQKPGFCWDKDDFEKTAAQNGKLGYQVKPIAPCPKDPYKVVNGDNDNDVTATWFSGAPIDQNGHQVKVDFNGAGHEPDVVIWGVRPIFSVDKQLFNSPQPMEVGNNAYFKIVAKNLDRARYDFLKAAYPSEFDSTVRDNPYGRNVRLTDTFQTGLDFVSGDPLTLTDEEGKAPYNGSTYALHRVGDKGILWDIMPLMGGGDSASTLITTRANLPGTWLNCAHLDADNMNQPRYEYNERYLYGFIGEADWTKFESPVFRPEPERNDLEYGICDCAWVRVIIKGQPFIHLTDVGERVLSDPKAEEKFDVRNGDEYFYQMTVSNNGDKTATGVEFKAISTAHIKFSSALTDHAIYISIDGGSTWSFKANADAVAANQQGIVFPPITLAPTDILRYSMKATAAANGNGQIVGTVSYSNNTVQGPIPPVADTTQIQNP